MDAKAKAKAFAAAVSACKKKMPDSVWYKDKTSYAALVERTDLPSIDLAIGTGGIPKRRIIELYGPEASGKTTLCLLIIAKVQARGGNVVYFDAENSLDPVWAAKLGVQMENLALIQQEDAASSLDAVRTIVQSNACDLFVVDSVAALVTKDELEGEMSDQKVAEQARLMSKLMRIINVDLLKTETIALFTNQIRDKIGVRYGNPETTPGGKALKFYASVRLDVRKASDEDAYKMGHHITKVRVAKNKVAPPFGVGHFRIDPTKGVVKSHSILEAALELKVINHSKGSKKYEYKGKEWTFEARLVKAIDEDEALQKDLMDDIYKNFADKTPVSKLPETINVPENTETDTEENVESEDFEQEDRE